MLRHLRKADRFFQKSLHARLPLERRVLFAIINDSNYDFEFAVPSTAAILMS